MIALYILWLGEIILLFLAFCWCKRDILCPAMMFIMVFTMAITIATLYCHNWEQIKTFDYLTTFIILSGSFIFLLVDYFVQGSIKSKRCINYNYGREEIRTENIKLFFIIIVDIFVILLFYKYMQGIVNSYGAKESYNVTSYSAAYRDLYGHDTVVSSDDQMSSLLRYGTYFLQMSAYVCLYPFINNVYIRKNKFFKNIKYFIPCLLFWIYGLLCGSRTDIIKTLVSAFFMLYILLMKNKGWKNANIKNIFKRGIKLVFIIFILFFVSSVIVGRSAVGNSIWKSFCMHIAGYAGAPIVHFNQFIEDPIVSQNPGEECFTNLYIFLYNHGLSSVVRTTHLEYRRLSGGIYGNVYTFFRRPLCDFGIIGMYIFVFIVALFFSLFYYKYIKYAFYKSKDRFGILLIIYSILFQWIAYSPIDQLSGEYVSISFIIKIFLLIIIYIFLFNLKIKNKKIIIK